jgi:hypothetical protein
MAIGESCTIRYDDCPSRRTSTFNSLNTPEGTGQSAKVGSAGSPMPRDDDRPSGRDSQG